MSALNKGFFVGAFYVVMLRCIWLAACANPAEDKEAQLFCSVWWSSFFKIWSLSGPAVISATCLDFSEILWSCLYIQLP